jgi:hypothetical protein
MLHAPPLGCNPLFGVLQRKAAVWRALGPPRQLQVGPSYHRSMDEWASAVAGGMTPMEIFGGDSGSFKALNARVGNRSLDLSLHFRYNPDFTGSEPETFFSCSVAFDGLDCGKSEPTGELTSESLQASVARACDDAVANVAAPVLREVRQAFRSTF